MHKKEHTSGSKPRGTAAKFTIAPLAPHTWIVAYANSVVPGAILRTKQAALDYVFALARAASLTKMDVQIGSSATLRARGRL